MAQRLLALDLDGTTLNHMGELSPAVRDAIAALPEEVAVVVATGRSIIATTPILEALGLRKGYFVCSNGALTLELDPSAELGYSVIDMVTFDPRPVLEKLRVELPDALIAVEEPGIGFKVSRHFPDGELMGHSREVDWDELVAHPVTRVTLRQPESSAEDFMELVERAGLHEVSYAVGWSAWLDINPEGVSKASALELVRRHLQVEPVHTIACGDQRNDLEMLHWAAWGVAMGNAPDQVKAIADEVTGHVDDDGLVPIVEAVSEAVRAGVPFRDGVPSAATARLEL
ncbi:HAD family hydrolase [Humibacillus xanthopallidus]|uniref:Hydroxymethylpyrimidine pyrophosphatase-like HAD family hydrolase n=1 Tax=Humibacillus xanthopallidus TaxID=412689 RepID=A0A543I2J6_9MICO|nr:HAD hydrolase family protein [Humibacillus xanthopallidus]TQM64816.1 hydroxymethylpyrimidine pyrophosphatase-like HAD family hydrolase [Humibacillus xanthopallidus]